MEEIFDKDFKTLGCYFYILDNLINIYIPKLYQHLK